MGSPCVLMVDGRFFTSSHLVLSGAVDDIALDAVFHTGLTGLFCHFHPEVIEARGRAEWSVTKTRQHKTANIQTAARMDDGDISVLPIKTLSVLLAFICHSCRFQTATCPHRFLSPLHSSRFHFPYRPSICLVLQISNVFRLP